MSWTPIDGRGMTVEAFAAYVTHDLDFPGWRPSGMVVHNTAAPSLAQWHSVSGQTRIQNLENYFRNERKWSAGPHAFVADDLIWVFTPFNKPGVHSPSWNGTKLGIEMVADFDVENPYSGAGFNVYKNTVALFALLHAKLGIDPDTIKLHKEDPETTHSCPGKLFLKPKFIADVHEYMGTAGELDHAPGMIDNPGAQAAPAVTPPPRIGHVGNVAANDTLNVRNRASANGTKVAEFAAGVRVAITQEEMNGSTKWFYVVGPNDGGWVSARYIKEG